ncbi:deaminated glutathione amidase isoform X1 [Neodiprion fabricii]|uniref:deaminated glutathione amidase isoform X1 n=2 Tax=Neodiprion fabricii TaxID=2872261 RepID=UPI001ED96561|nr:deaminated glutathione amidase isoform X1 [Neodiprion fabricii]XP_046426625.1 deaminated glutathione amidase isoform X1 [Neodiprion fabricii]
MIRSLILPLPSLCQFTCNSSIFVATRALSTMSTRLVAVCQMTSTGDREKNFEVVSSLVSQAKGNNACIAMFPEACDYLADNKKDIVAMAEPLDGELMRRYKCLARNHDICLSLGGIHEKSAENRDKIYNSHVLINNRGEMVAVYRKIHLFDMDNPETGVRLMESDYVDRGGEILPPVQTPAGLMGLSICYDMRFPEISLSLRKMGAQILTFPSAFTYQTGAAHWEVILRARAIESQCYVIAAAQTGAHNKKRVSWGHAMIVDPWGTVIAQCAERTGIAVAEIDLDLLDKIRKNMPCDKHRRTDLYPELKPLEQFK